MLNQYNGIKMYERFTMFNLWYILKVRHMGPLFNVSNEKGEIAIRDQDSKR